MSDIEPKPPEALSHAQEFAKWILEEMDKPTTPEQEAYETQKELEDREAYKHFYRISGQVKATVAEAISTLIYSLKSLPKDGTFDLIEVQVTGLHGRKAILSLGSSPLKAPFRRYAELRVYTLSEISHSSQWLDNGTNEELLAFLQRASISSEIDELAKELMISLERNNLA